MRLRIQTAPPLPPLKAWFIPDLPYPTATRTNNNIPTHTHDSDAEVPTTIADLKKTLCARVQILRHKDDGPGKSRLGAEDAMLLLDGFELLDDMPFVRGGEGAVRDGYLVVVGLKMKEKEKQRELERDTELDGQLGRCREQEDVRPGIMKVSAAAGTADDAPVNGGENGNKRKHPPAPVACPPQSEQSAKKPRATPIELPPEPERAVVTKEPSKHLGLVSDVLDRKPKGLTGLMKRRKPRPQFDSSD